MTKYLLPLIFIFHFASSQNTIGTISVSPEVYDGYTLFSSHTKSFLIDNCGQVINSWNSNYLPGNSVYLLPNGNLLRAGRFIQTSNPVSVPGSGGIVELFDWDGNIIWSWTDSSDTSRQHHDIFPMPNGNILVLSATVMSDSEAIQAGRDPNLLDDGELYNERIYEVEPIGSNGGNIVWEWNVKDHLIQDLDATKDNFGVVSDNPGKLNINFLNGFPAENNWLHINSIQFDQEFDQIVISSRRLSEIWIIDHSTTTASATGPAGDFLYRWGNPEAYNQGNSVDRKLYGQHTPYYIPSGFPNERKIMLFNNGINRTPSYSEVLIIDPPVDLNGNYSYTPNTAYGPSTTDFRYPETAPTEDSEFYSAIVSSGRQLSNGNILICEGREGFFFEIDSNNTIVWEYAVPISNSDGSIYDQGSPIPPNNFAFRATKYSLDYEAFEGRDLTNPDPPIENNPDITDCLNILSTTDTNVLAFKVYPNPVNDFIYIDSNANIDKIEIFNIEGSRINAETTTDLIDFRGLGAGVYFVRIFSDGKRVDRKIIKQ